MFEAGALVLLPFPYSDATTTKRRLVLALTSPDEYGDFIGMAVSGLCEMLQKHIPQA